MMNAAWENLLGATRALTTGEPIKQRLAAAYSGYVEKLDPADLPREARVVLKELVERLSSTRPLRGETTTIATIRKMSNDEAEACATAIVQLLSLCGRAQLSTVDLPSGVVPLYPTLTDNVPPFVAVNRA